MEGFGVLTLTKPVDAQQVFKRWSLHRAGSEKAALSQRSIATYQSLWNTWCSFLAEASSGLPQPIGWSQATSVEVRNFLESLVPRAQLRGLVNASSVTQRRYHRVLKKIYDYAVAQEWLQTNPVDKQASVSPSEQMDSLVFHGMDWQMLLDALPDAQQTLDVSAVHWLVIRDAAVLRLMMQASLTVAELAGLDIGDVEHASSGWIRGSGELWADKPALASFQSLDNANNTQNSIILHLNGSRAAQKRAIVLTDATSESMHAWLRLRKTLPMPQGIASPLLVSRKKAGRLTPRALFHVANRHIGWALSERYPDRILAHAGPMTLRNSCIVRWLDSSMPDAEILQAAGLKDLPALQRLRKHVHPGASQTLQAVD